MDLRRIEETSLKAWPALEQEWYDGWILRFAEGYTKRSNSVNPIHSSTKDLSEKVLYCERRYQEKGLTPLFRITPFVSPPDIDHYLDRESYRRIDPTWVLTKNLDDLPIQRRPESELQMMKLDEWLNTYSSFHEGPFEGHQSHKKILERVPSKKLFASLRFSGEVVACGIGVIECAYFGLFELITHPTQRGRGYGTDLIMSMMKWARDHGAGLAYLQVLETNAAAYNLYTKCGFKEAYPYWYRVR
jgi:ribosomal protein S18 acetylase RimI-like enzyme